MVIDTISRFFSKRSGRRIEKAWRVGETGKPGDLPVSFLFLVLFGDGGRAEME